jgi:hypothetical protein
VAHYDKLNLLEYHTHLFSEDRALQALVHVKHIRKEIVGLQSKPDNEEGEVVEEVEEEAEEKLQRRRLRRRRKMMRKTMMRKMRWRAVKRKEIELKGGNHNRTALGRCLSIIF